MSHSDVDPGLARLRLPLVILAQPAVATKPGEGPLDDPTPRQNLESLLLLGADDHLKHPTADLHRPFRDASIIDPIGQDLLQPRELAPELLQDLLGPIPVLNARRVDHRRHDQAQCVDDQVPLPPVDLLERILAPRAHLLGGLDALAVDDRHAGTLLPTVAVADLGPQGVVDLREGVVVAPLAEVIVAGAPGG